MLIGFFNFRYNIFNRKSDKNYYSVNVSDIVEKSILNYEKIEHLNFTKLILENKISVDQNIYEDNDPGSHLKEKYQSEIFLKNIFKKIQE